MQRVLAVIVWISGCSSESPVAPIDAASTDTASTDTATDAVVDPCSSPAPKAVSGPGDGEECSPTKPCDSNYDCLYLAPGCDAPKGVCRRWQRCADVAISGQYCGCDGKDIWAGGVSPAPYSKLGLCGGDAGGD